MGGWQNSYRPANGYGVELSSSSGTVSLLKSVAGTQTSLGTIAGANKLVTTKQWLRVKIVGSVLSVKVWADGTPEPAAWTTATDTAVTAPGEVEYEVLCRRHYMRRMNSRAARAGALSPDVLPFDLDVCAVPPPRTS